MNLLILIAGIAANASASVLVKVAMTTPRRVPSLADPFAAFTNGPLLLGVGLYGTAFILYAAALARMPINVAQPVLTSGAIAAVAVLSVALFHEPFPWTTALGIGLVIVGVALIAGRVT